MATETLESPTPSGTSASAASAVANIPTPERSPLPSWLVDRQVRASAGDRQSIGFNSDGQLRFSRVHKDGESPGSELAEVVATREYEAGQVIDNFGHFDIDCDLLYPQLMTELGISDDQLDQYWLTILNFFARKDAAIAIIKARANARPANHLRFLHDNPKRWENRPKDGTPNVRGWTEYTKVEITPDREVKEGETIDIDGVEHVCIEEGGCRRMRGGVMEGGHFWRVDFHERQAGKGVEQANRDAPGMYLFIRGYSAA